MKKNRIKRQRYRNIHGPVSNSNPISIDESNRLKHAHNELGRILNNVNYGFFSRNIITNTYTYLSEACGKIYGYTVDDFFNNTLLWFEVIIEEDKAIVKSDSEKLKNGENVCTQYRIKRPDEIVRWVELTIIPHLENEILTRVDGVIEDITERKIIEFEREQILKELMKSNADFKQFSYIISHNLRAPLSNINGIISMFNFKDADSQNGQLLELLKISTKQLNSTIDDLSKILIIKNNADHVHSIENLPGTFNIVLQTFAKSIEDIHGIITTNFKAPLVKLSKLYLESIFVNLISNAIKYHSPSRNLVINIISNEDEDGYVVMRFSDNGTGIDLKKHEDKIFGLYQRFHKDIEGQGMGLFMIKSQIEAAGGSIHIESELDVGTTFILKFPK